MNGTWELIWITQASLGRIYDVVLSPGCLKPPKARCILAPLNALASRLVQQGKEVICETSQSSIGHGARFVGTDCNTCSESLRQEVRIQEGTGQVRQEGR